ncbi:D-alanyl-D-alanine carboxypeptidase family protein [Oceanobacillus massiliensis]|uniref:D-alanyl-D-alanine carboxypeptidase family protein n=1 Tax=Oceanobacillus massiliensis TaxID=1465765 RepID=UPI003019B81C
MKKTGLMMIVTLVLNMMFVPQSFADSSPPSPEIESEAAILLEANSGQVLYDKNANAQMYPASVTKIATAIFAIETGKLDDVVTVSENASARNVEGTTVFLEEGEEVPLKKLIQGLLINSGNDAGVAIAEHLSGSVSRFSKELNTYLEDVIGTTQTNFVNPHGLFDEKHLTTAADLAKITEHALKNDDFRKIFGTKELEWHGKTWNTTIQTHHKLVKEEIPYDGVTGGKNGFVSLSGYTLVTSAERDGVSLIAVTLKSSTDDQAYSDTINLLDYGFENFNTSSIGKGDMFRVEGEEYTATHNISYTYSPDDDIHKIMEEDGTLKIVNQRREIASFQLEKVNDESSGIVNKASAKGSSDNQNGSSIFDKVLSGLPVFIIALVLVMILLLFVKMIKRKFNKNDNYFY